MPKCGEDAAAMLVDHLAYLSIRCNPDAVSTIPLTSPGFSAKAASSNSFCISFLPKKPRSPLFQALLRSDPVTAKSPSVVCPDRICCSYPRRISFASSNDLVICGCLQLLGFLLLLCLTRRWAALIFPSGGAVPSVLVFVELWFCAMYVLRISVSVPSGGSHLDSRDLELK